DILAIDVKPLDYIPKEDTPQKQEDRQHLEETTVNIIEEICSSRQKEEEDEVVSANFHCSECMKPYANKLVLRAHLRRHLKASQFKCKICNLTFRYAGKLAVYENLKELKDHVNTHEKLQMCDLCGKNFRSRKALKDHLRLHSGDKPYKCEDCEKKFATASHLSSHRRIHKTAKLHKCE
uniref:C2H2-type domain-containing protein n=1 Tax=Phlebotomus papatasi TaxID=29031 RepID=A0A1B0GQ29_PHLPP